MDKFKFNISLSVLNHLGRNLYRSFITVLGEAISNAWDADATEVRIYIDRENNFFVVKDDGVGMDREDFQNKFLKIGYSKRKDGKNETSRKRPFIGRKGIGKLALLSCAKKISILSRKSSKDAYIGGVIDNQELDDAIKGDLSTEEYPLTPVNNKIFEKFLDGHDHGTIIMFQGLKDGIRNTENYLRYAIALCFRFSLIDNSFRIFINEREICIENLSKLVDDTQFLWEINDISDPFIEKLRNNKKLKIGSKLNSELTINGFIATVQKPSQLKIQTSEDKVSLDLYVNGRLREKDIIKNISTSRIVENYIYGQIHFNAMDDDKDRFTSSREGVIPNDDLFSSMLDEVKKFLTTVLDEWDKMRVEINEDGDSENPRMNKKERKSRELFNTVSKDFEPDRDSPNREQVDEWIDSLRDDAQFNFLSYSECFISENLLRKYIEQKKISIEDFILIAEKLKKSEQSSMKKGNLSITIRENPSHLSYLGMDNLAKLADRDKSDGNQSVARDAKEYKPIRDAVAHTALLTKVAKNRLNTTYENIKARIQNLLNEDI